MPLTSTCFCCETLFTSGSCKLYQDLYHIGVHHGWWIVYKIVSSSRWNLFCVDFIVAFINHHSRYWKCLMVNNMIVQIYHGHLSEVDSRRYFQQLIDNVDYCHCNGVYHIDLKVCIAWDLKSCLLPLWWFLLIFLFSLCSLKIFYLIH